MLTSTITQGASILDAGVRARPDPAAARFGAAGSRPGDLQREHAPLGGGRADRSRSLRIYDIRGVDPKPFQAAAAAAFPGAEIDRTLLRFGRLPFKLIQLLTVWECR